MRDKYLQIAKAEPERIIKIQTDKLGIKEIEKQIRLKIKESVINE